jgi:hypothetical protein
MQAMRRKAMSRKGIADQAWGNLTSAAQTGGDKAKVYGAKVAGGSKEAKRRVDLAVDALAGKKPPNRWGWLAGAAVLGVALGWVVTTFGRRAVTAAQDQFAAEPEDLTLYADEVTPAH